AALGGSATLQGVPDRAPVKASIPQVWRHTGAESAVAGMIAHARMRTTGVAQHVDVSAQSAMTWTLLNAMEAYEIQGFDIERSGTTAKLAIEVELRQKAADGYVIAIPRGGFIEGLLGWMIEAGVADESWREEDWSTFEHRLLSGEETKFSFADMQRALAELCAKYDKDALMRRALELGQTIAPINSVDDLLHLDHLQARRTWVDAHIGDDSVQLPGVHASVDGRRIEPRRRPPHIDEHGAEVRAQLDSQTERRAPRALGVSEERNLPLAGLKVADFSWIGVGPITAKSLADHGATVVRIESGGRLDGLRNNPPFKDGVNDVNLSHFFGAFNTSKLSIDIDLKNPTGLDIARRMIEWADVVIESWTPGAFARLGFDADTLRELNPTAIVVSTSLLASGGPLSEVAGYGYHAGAMAGFYEVVGWEDLPPDGPYLAYTDTIAPRFIAPTLLAAIARRESTGEGCHIEVAQLECGLQFLAPEFLDLQLNGRVATRHGNRDLTVAPQGMYPCSGDDQWCAISVSDDAAWERLVGELERPEWALDPLFATLAGRTAGHDLIDEHLGEWTAGQDADELAARLVAMGIPAGKAQRSSDLLADPQYAHRGFYRRLEHGAMGEVPYAGHQYRIDGYDHGPRFAAPTLGQHTFDVLTDLLEMDPDEIAEVAVSGALG
ncbi:MAG: CoA transferase, partial [Actinomycetota bacterium]|nr:CoA transferase [Actinomycetota bacterium]